MVQLAWNPIRGSSFFMSEHEHVMGMIKAEDFSWRVTIIRLNNIAREVEGKEESLNAAIISAEDIMYNAIKYP